MPKRKCKLCKEYSETFVKHPVGTFCTHEHAVAYASEKSRKARERQYIKAKAAEKKKHAKRKKEVTTRREWFDKLQTLVNQYVMHVRDVGKPCCTCGTSRPGIKYDAGHCFTRAARSDIRFELTNIHRQCSVRCNQHGSGMRAEYKQFIADKYGHDHLAWLEEEKPDLKEQFPDWTDIEKEILRYRKLLRDNGIKPHV